MPFSGHTTVCRSRCERAYKCPRESLVPAVVARCAAATPAIRDKPRRFTRPHPGAQDMTSRRVKTKHGVDEEQSISPGKSILLAGFGR
jgi:hypothetical protein